MTTTRRAAVLAVLTATLVLVVLCAPAWGAYGWDVAKITDDAFDAWVPDSWAPMNPQVDRGHVVWRGFDGLDGEIFFHDAAADTTTQLTGNNIDDAAPQIAGDYVVWQRDTSSAAEIYLYRISTRETFRITNDSAMDFGPQTDGRWVVWVHVDGAQRDIYLFDTVSGMTTPVTNDAEDDLFPQVDGGYVAWQKGESADAEIHLYRIANGVDVRVTTNGYLDEVPQIDAGLVVWQANLTGALVSWEIFSYDIGTGITKQLTVDAYQDHAPQVDAGRVVWYTVGGQVHLYDAASGATSLLAASDPLVGHVGPQVSGDTVVWEAIAGPGLSGIDAYDVTTGGTAARLLGGDYVHGPQVDGGLVTWQGWDGDDWEIYLARKLTPTEHALEVLERFDSAVDTGTLVGAGRGWAADIRLRVVRGMLDRASDLVAAGRRAGALAQLRLAYLLCDGVSPPQDFVSGSAAPALAGDIQALSTTLRG